MKEDLEGDWYENLRRKLWENGDMRYVLRDGTWKYIIAFFTGFAGLVFLSIGTAIVALITHKLGL